MNFLKAGSTRITDLKSAIFLSFTVLYHVAATWKETENMVLLCKSQLHIIFFPYVFQCIKYLKQCHHSSKNEYTRHSPLVAVDFEEP